MKKEITENNASEKGKIIVADYISYTDRDGKPIGHPLKVIKECAKLIERKYDVMYAAHSLYLDKLRENNNVSLPYRITEGKTYTSLYGKIQQLAISYRNIHKIYRIKDVKYIWFCNVDIFLFFYLLLHRKKCEKTIITIYLSKFPKKYQNRIFLYISRKIKLLITTNINASYFGENRLNIPDYLYFENEYKKYRKANKQNKVVCVGGMGEQKDLIGLIKAFNLNGYKLEVIGHFPDKELYCELKRLSFENIEIKDTYLEYDEYMQIIAGAKFCVLPYQEDVYYSKTSGVILESIFVGTIPICNEELLQRWQICGVGYRKIAELGEKKWCLQNMDDIVKKNNRLIHDNYTDRYHSEELLKRL